MFIATSIASPGSGSLVSSSCPDFSKKPPPPVHTLTTCQSDSDCISDHECCSYQGNKYCIREKGKGPRPYLCTQVPCLAVIKWNRSIITESNIFCKSIIPIIRKEYALLLLTTTLTKIGRKRSYFCAQLIVIRKSFFKWLFPQWSSYIPFA